MHIGPATIPAPLPSPMKTHKTVRNIILVPFKNKPSEWGSWHVKDTQSTSTSTNPIPENVENHVPSDEEGEIDDPQTPDYSPRHPPEFYEDK